MRVDEPNAPRSHSASNLVAALRLAIELLGDDRLSTARRAAVLRRMEADLERLIEQLEAVL